MFEAAQKGVDGRKYWARRFEESVRLILSELGDAERLSAGEQGLVRQAATLMIAGDQISARAPTETRWMPTH